MIKLKELFGDQGRPIIQDTPNEFAYLDFKKWAYKNRGKIKNKLEGIFDGTQFFITLRDIWVLWANEYAKEWSSTHATNIAKKNFGRALAVMMKNDNLIINKESNNLLSLKEDLCKKGKAYIAKRKRAGEKSSAYLSGRAVRVCKGQIKGESIEEKIDESLRDWFKKEDWVRINTSGNISGECGTMKKGKATTRCLPRKKAQSLTKAERKATVAKKVRGSKKGKQFVKNTSKAKYKKKS